MESEKDHDVATAGVKSVVMDFGLEHGLWHDHDAEVMQEFDGMDSDSPGDSKKRSAIGMGSRSLGWTRSCAHRRSNCRAVKAEESTRDLNRRLGARDLERVVLVDGPRSAVAQASWTSLS